jgi:hypothetical protein
MYEDDTLSSLYVIYQLCIYKSISHCIRHDMLRIPELGL